MKRFYLVILLLTAITTLAGAQDKWNLAKIISDGKSGEFYTIRNDLVGVYCPPHHTNTIFAKDDNEYGNKSHPTQEQVEANHLYDEKDGYFDDWDEWVGTFDQSNWVKIALPAGVDGNQYVGKIISGGSVTGRANIQEVPCRPLGLTMTIEADPDHPERPVTPPTVGAAAAYEPNLYCCGNFVKQDEWYLVKPQNQEYANIRWAVWHAADTMFYAPKNQSGLPGSFKIDMSLWEPQPGIDPFEVFSDGYQYEFPAMIEFRLGFTLNINIDPGFSGENNIHFAPRRMPVTDMPGVAPTYTDADGNVYPYTVIVYPLRLPQDGVLTGIDGPVDNARVATSTRYVDLQGRSSDKAFEGLNIVVTTYSDGTTSTAKIMK